jgi:putative two-component system response regulator
MLLIVDDHPDICYVLQRMAKNLEKYALTAYDAETALEIMHEKRPGLVILDDMMPGMSGIEVLAKMRADPALSSVPVVMYSAADQVERRREAERLGAVAWVRKDGDVTQIKQYISALAQ